MAQLNDTIVQGDLRVTGDLLGNFHKIVAQSYGYVEFSDAPGAYGLLATIDISNIAGYNDVHAIFHVQDIRDSSVLYRGDKKVIVDVRTNSDSTSYSYAACCTKYGTSQGNQSIKVYYTDKQNLRIYAYNPNDNEYGGTLCRLESCTGWGGSDLSRRVTMHRGGTVSTTTPSGVQQTVTDYDFVAKTSSAGSTSLPVYVDSSGTPKAISSNMTLPSSGATDTYISCGIDDYKRVYLDVTNEAGSSGSRKAGVYTKWGTSSSPHSQWLCYTDENGKGFFKGTADAASEAAHLGSFGSALTWPYSSSAGKPYALLANKGIATTSNWSFGQLFKLEVANAFAIFKVSVKGSTSAVTEARTDVLYFCNMTRAQLEQILVVRYGFTANEATNGAIVAIYADMSKVANLLSVYTRATLRQLDNQSDGQYAYEHWNPFTFFTNEMVASAGGAAPTMNVMYYTKDEIDGAFSVVNNNINNITSGYKIRIVSTIPSSFDANTIYFI